MNNFYVLSAGELKALVTARDILTRFDHPAAQDIVGFLRHCALDASADEGNR